ncbi:type II secretion system protein [Nitrospina sp. 32_T5]|uniref:type II secretion system protein n=1 Tax=unclassified Nitrospina TaxID=2638683 RepID=UPI003F950673
MFKPDHDSVRRQSGWKSELGFTFIEMVMVIVMIGLLASVAIQRMFDMARQAEVTAEATTIEILRSNLLTVMGEQMLQGKKASFPESPFSDLNKIPEGYDPRRREKPTGLDRDDNLWVYVRATGSEILSPEEAGTTLTSFDVDGFIYHQRNNGKVFRWAYDRSRGAISRKFQVPDSELEQAVERISDSDWD